VRLSDKNEDHARLEWNIRVLAENAFNWLTRDKDRLIFIREDQRKETMLSSDQRETATRRRRCQQLVTKHCKTMHADNYCLRCSEDWSLRGHDRQLSDAANTSSIMFTRSRSIDGRSADQRSTFWHIASKSRGRVSAVQRGDWKCGSGKCGTGIIARVGNAGVRPMDRQPENKLRWRRIKLIQICYPTYDIHIIRQYNICVTLHALFSFLVHLIWHL